MANEFDDAKDYLSLASTQSSINESTGRTLDAIGRSLKALDEIAKMQDQRIDRLYSRCHSLQNQVFILMLLVALLSVWVLTLTLVA